MPRDASADTPIISIFGDAGQDVGSDTGAHGSVDGSSDARADGAHDGGIYVFAGSGGQGLRQRIRLGAWISWVMACSELLRAFGRLYRTPH